MKKNEILSKIGSIINDLSDQHEYLSKTENYNFIELELFNANAKFLIEHLEILKKLTSLQTNLTNDFSENATIRLPENHEKEAIVTINQTPEQIHIVNEIDNFNIDLSPLNVNEEEKELLFDFEQGLKVEEIYDRDLSDEEAKILNEKQNLITSSDVVVNQTHSIINENVNESNDIKHTYNQIEKLDEAKSEDLGLDINDNESIEVEAIEIAESKPRTINDMLSANQNANVSSRFIKIPSSDLKSIITLNDKLIFIKHLFNGYNLAYSEAIEILNRFDSFESADNFLQKNYAEKNKWADKQDVVDRFYDILNRKYLK